MMDKRKCVDCQEVFQPVNWVHVRCGSVDRKLGCSYKHRQDTSRERSRRTWLRQKLPTKEKKSVEFIPDYSNETIIKVN